MVKAIDPDMEEVADQIEEEEVDPEWVKGKEEKEPHYEFEVFLSTDGKQTVHVKADTPEGKRKALKVATDTYDYIVARYGTKPKMWGEVMKKNGESAKPSQATCKHTNIKFAQSRTEKNPNRWFKSCRDCGKFLGWQD